MGTVFPPTLRRGSNGANVLTLQNNLSKLGYNLGNINGVFNLATEEAVIQFQRDYGLTVNGVVSAQTNKTLGLSVNKIA